jgi:hypothetical protein
VDDAGAGICGHLSSDVKADQRKRQSTSAASSRSAGAWARTVSCPKIPTSSAIRGILQLRREGLSLRAISAAISAEGVKLSHEGVKNALASADATAA